MGFILILNLKLLVKTKLLLTVVKCLVKMQAILFVQKNGTLCDELFLGFYFIFLT